MITQSLAPYMRWAKTRPAVRIDLASSNLLPCDIGDLPGALEVLALAGPNGDGFVPLVQRVADHYGIPQERVATAAGTSGANFLVYAALIGPGDEVLVERPGYDPLAGAARLFGADVRSFERPFDDGFHLDVDRCASQVTGRTRLVVLTNLHNPSGAPCGTDALQALAARLLADGRDVHVLVDEVYLDAAVGTPPASAATLSGPFIVTSSLTKSYGLPGLRCGWIVASPDVISRVRLARDVVDGVGAFPAEVLSALAFDHLDALRRRAQALVAGNLDLVRDFVTGRPDLSWVPPAGGTVCFPRLDRSATVEPLVRLLREKYDTAVVDGAFFGAPQHMRLSFGGARGHLAEGLRVLGCALDDLAAA